MSRSWTVDARLTASHAIFVEWKKKKPSCCQRDTLANGFPAVRVLVTTTSNLYLNLNRSRMKTLINITLSDIARMTPRVSSLVPPTFSSDESRCYDVIQSSMTSQGVRYESRRRSGRIAAPMRWDENKEEHGSSLGGKERTRRAPRTDDEKPAWKEELFFTTRGLTQGVYPIVITHYIMLHSSYPDAHHLHSCNLAWHLIGVATSFDSARWLTISF